MKRVATGEVIRAKPAKLARPTLCGVARYYSGINAQLAIFHAERVARGRHRISL